MKPDITCYDSGKGRESKTDFSSVEVVIEVKIASGDDPFDDEAPDSIESASVQGSDTRNQIISYAVAQLAMQFRSHIFSVIIVKDCARLIRWDRSGAVVTAAFRYAMEKSLLVEFFRRYGLVGLKARGHDESVEKPSAADADRAREVLGLGLDVCLVKLAVCDDHAGKRDSSTAYYVAPSDEIMKGPSVTGRCTRTFIALELHTGRKVFLKDTWRVDHPMMSKEGDIYRELHTAKVSNIAPLVRAGDVQDHKTLTDKFTARTWVRRPFKPLRPHRHYRLVLGIVGSHLTEFNSSWQVVNVLADALQG